MPWNSWRLLGLCLPVGFAFDDVLSPQTLAAESVMLQSRHTASAKRFSVECVLNIWEEDEDSTSADACDFRFAFCASEEGVYYVRDDAASDTFVLESIVPGSTVVLELEEVYVEERLDCTMPQPWKDSGSPLYRAISATPVGGASFSEIRASPTYEMGVLMIVVRIPNTSNHWDEDQVYEDLLGSGTSLNNLSNHPSNGRLKVSTSRSRVEWSLWSSTRLGPPFGRL